MKTDEEIEEKLKSVRVCRDSDRAVQYRHEMSGWVQALVWVLGDEVKTL